ncbi:2106_t:CDS:1, partial [Gigaspora margarita]
MQVDKNKYWIQKVTENRAQKITKKFDTEVWSYNHMIKALEMEKGIKKLALYTFCTQL